MININEDEDFFIQTKDMAPVGIIFIIILTIALLV
jgi:hypothetical protein